jgi:ABC-type multidrug transport system, ATPase component
MDPIRISHLSKKIGNTQILDDISLTVQSGEIFSYLGPNGAGKTTTLRILLNILKPTSGTVTVLGTDVTRPEYRFTRKKIGFVLENAGLYEYLTAADNLEFYDRLYNAPLGRQKRIDGLLEQVDLSSVKNKPVSTFSFGMKQRLALARALINDPLLLILDEPMKGLDVEGRVMIRNLLIDLKKKGTTIFLNSHDLDEMQRISSRIAVINKGKLLLCDSYEHLAKGTTHIELEIGTSAESLRELDTIPWITSWHQEGNNVRIELENPECRNRLSRVLTDMGIDILEMKTEKRGLEEIYLDLVRNDEVESDE